MSSIKKTTEWEGKTVRLVQLHGLKRHANFPYSHTKRRRYHRIPGRQIDRVFWHTSAGNFKEGVSAPRGIANFHAGHPKLKDGKRVGGGRGWPGAGYTFCVPWIPETVDGKLEVYRLWEDEWWTWHTGRITSKTSVAIVFSGSHISRHAPRFSERARDPHPLQFQAGRELTFDYLLPRYGLEVDALGGHFEAGKVACPGDVLEAFIRHSRGEPIPWLEPSRRIWDENRPIEDDPQIARGTDMETNLDRWIDRQKALVRLGFDPGPVDGIFGVLTRSALEAFQADVGLDDDGFWGPDTEREMRFALFELPNGTG